MKYDHLSPEQLLDQLVDNSASLCQADWAFKAAHERGNELFRAFQAQMDADRRFERRVQLGLFAMASIAGCAAYLFYPDWLGEQIASLSSLF